MLILSFQWSRSNHVLPCRPSGITLDIKKSSYKKLSKWLQAKSSSGLVSLNPFSFTMGNKIYGISNFVRFQSFVAL